MKTKHILLSFTVITAFYLSACQKDFSVENGSQSFVDSTNVADSNYLSKIIFTNTIGNITDTFSEIRYEYDTFKRVIKLTDEPISTPGFEEKNTSTYFYIGMDTLPNKKIEITESNSKSDTTVSYYYYNSEGKRIRDSTLEYKYSLNGNGNNFILFDKTIANYQYTANKIYGTSITTNLYNNNIPNVSSFSIELDTATLDVNNNLIASKKWRSSNSNVYIISNQATVTYDNKPSPFYKLSNFKTLNIFPYGETFFNELQAKNNRLHIVEGYMGTGYNEDLTGKYEYKMNGYPKQILVNTATEIVKIIFVYKVL
jgi:hypothetical protein